MDSFQKISSATNPDMTLLVLVSSPEREALLRASIPLLEGRFTTWLLNTGRISSKKLLSAGSEIAVKIQALAVKRASLVTFDEAGTIAQLILSNNPQIVRRAIIVDPTARTPLGLFANIKEWCQRHCAIPLPFRIDENSLDIRYLQHRISCPLLVVQSKTPPTEQEPTPAKSLADRAPNAWLLPFSELEQTENPVEPIGVQTKQLHFAFLDLLMDFIEVPSKRSQKNLSSANQGKAKVTSLASEQDSIALDNPSNASSAASSAEASRVTANANGSY